MSSNESTSNSSLDSCNCTDDTPKTSTHCCNADIKNKKSSFTLIAQNLRRKPLNLNKRVRKCVRQTKDQTPNPVKTKSNKWVMKFNCAKKEKHCPDDRNMKCCVCTCYRRTDEHHLGAGVVFQSEENPEQNEVKEEKEESELEASTSSEQSDDVNVSPNKSSDVYGNLGNAIGGASIILGGPVDISW